jgi:hypothetical protein
MKEPTNPINRGREDWVVNLVEFIKGRPTLTFDPLPLFEHLERIEMAYCVGKRLVLPTCVRPQYEIKDVRFGMFPVMMSLN